MPRGESHTMGSEKKENKKPSTGIKIVAFLNFFFAIAAFILGYIAMASLVSSSNLLATWLYIRGTMMFVSGIGLLELRFWAWLLSMIGCLVGLVEFAFHPNAIPLELIVLPYLLIKRKSFKR